MIPETMARELAMVAMCDSIERDGKLYLDADKVRDIIVRYFSGEKK